MTSDIPTREIFGNIDAVSKGVFYVLTVLSVICFFYGLWRRLRLWRLGRPGDQKIDWVASIKRLFTQVLDQRKLRQARSRAGWAHTLLFYGFGILLIGTILVGIEHYAQAIWGREPVNPVFHKGLYFILFEFMLDAAGLALLAGCIWFALRRAQAKSSMAHHISDWIVIGSLITLGISGYFIEAARIIREDTALAQVSFVGYSLAKLFESFGINARSASTMHFVLWWFHAVVALGFVAYVPYCRLLHIIAGSIQLTTHRPALGQMAPVSIEEFEETGIFGVGRIEDFSRLQLMELDACVSCGRCEDVCPAYEAGKPLSPRDLVQDIRAHLDRAGPILLADGDSDSDKVPQLHGQTISADTLWSCTTCNACVDVCPLGVQPMRMITDMRRHLIGDGQLRGSPATALQKLQRSGNPWGLPVEDRLRWADGLDVPTVESHPDFEILYWVGCAAAYDRRTQNVARAMVKLLKAANVNFAVLGTKERCTGESARRMGDEFVFAELAESNVATLANHKVKRILTHCPHCLNSFKNDYPQLGGQYDIVHHTQLLAELVEQGRLPDIGNVPTEKADGRRITYHDPCYLARVNDVVDPPRQLIQLTISKGENSKFTEMPRHGRDTSCCGAGGGRMWFDDSPDQRIGQSRINEALATNSDTIAVSCPFCNLMMRDGVAGEASNVRVIDVAELLAEAMELDVASRP